MNNKALKVGLVTVLAVIGGVSVFMYFRKPRKNSDGFFNASGNSTSPKSNVKWCAHRNSDGSVSYQANTLGGGCPKNFVQVKEFGDRTGV